MLFTFKATVTPHHTKSALKRQNNTHSTFKIHLQSHYFFCNLCILFLCYHKFPSPSLLRQLYSPYKVCFSSNFEKYSIYKFSFYKIIKVFLFTFQHSLHTWFKLFALQ